VLAAITKIYRERLDSSAYIINKAWTGLSSDYTTIRHGICIQDIVNQYKQGADGHTETETPQTRPNLT